MASTLQLDDLGTRVRLVLRAEAPTRPATLDLSTLASLQAACEQIRDTPRWRLASIEVESDRYFVVGADIRELTKLDGRSIDPWVRTGHEVLNALAMLPIMTVAVVSGVAMGGGLELALACDLIVATRNAQFGLPEAALGLIPGWGGTTRLPRRVGPAVSVMMMLTARTLDAEEAHRVGLADLLADDRGAAQELVAAIAEDAAKLSAQSVSEIKQLLCAATGPTDANAEARASVRCFDEGDASQRIQAFLTERAARKARQGRQNVSNPGSEA